MNYFSKHLCVNTNLVRNIAIILSCFNHTIYIYIWHKIIILISRLVSLNFETHFTVFQVSLHSLELSLYYRASVSSSVSLSSFHEGLCPWLLTRKQSPDSIKPSL